MKQFITFVLLFFCSNLLLSQRLSPLVAPIVKHDSLHPSEKIYLQTDRSLYQADEIIWFSVWVSNAANMPSYQGDKIFVKLIDPKGSVKEIVTLHNQSGTANHYLSLKKDYPGGIYTIKAYTSLMEELDTNAFFKKKITLQKVVLPNVLMSLDFEKEAYGASSKVVAFLELKSRINKPLAHKKISCTIQLNESVWKTFQAKTNSKGKATIRYKLPRKLKISENLLNISFAHRGLNESITRAAPIVFGNLDIQFLPEGGQLVAHQKNRVAIKVLNEFGEPADIKAQLLDPNDKVIQHFETYHKGMGAFVFEPQKDKKYSIRILEPKNIKTTYTLPLAKSKIGFFLKQNDAQSVAFDVYSPQKQVLDIVARQKGKIVFAQQITAQKGANSLRFPSSELPIGIIQITVFDTTKTPQAERLVFANKHRKIAIKINTDQMVYRPRQKVDLELDIQDETGKGVQGNFSLAVVNEKNLSFADDKQDNILTCLLLSSELKGEIYEPNFYFDPKEEKADSALDYVMLTHGWRGFEWTEILTPSLPVVSPVQKEISGYLEQNNQLITNQLIYISETQNDSTHSETIAQTYTDSNGLFCFENIKISFPAYISTRLNPTVEALIKDYSTKGTYQKYSRPIWNINYKKTAYNYSKINGYIRYVQGTKSVPNSILVLYRNDSIFDKTIPNSNGEFYFGTLDSASYHIGIYSFNYSPYFSKKIIINKHNVKLSVQLIQERDSIVALPPMLARSTVNRTYSVKKNSTIRGYVSMNGNNKLLSSIRVVLMQKYSSPKIVYTDKNGFFELKNIKEGFYRIYFYHKKYLFDNDYIIVKDHSMIFLNHKMIWNKKKETTVDYFDKKRNRRSNKILGAEDIYTLATRDVNSVAATVRGVLVLDEGEALNLNGSRSNNLPIPILWKQTPIQGKEPRSNTMDLTAISRVPHRITSKIEAVGNIKLIPLKLTKIQYVPPVFFRKKDYQKKQNPEVRDDFRNTIHWQTNIRTNSLGKNIEAINYYNSDEITSFRIVLEGLGKKGHIVHAEKIYNTNLLLNITAKIPHNLYWNDTINIPVVVQNNSDKKIEGQLSWVLPSALQLLNQPATKVQIKANSSLVTNLLCAVVSTEKNSKIRVEIQTPKRKEAIQLPLQIQGKGFLRKHSIATMQKTIVRDFDLDEYYKGSITSKLHIYSSTVNKIVDGLEGILETPSGCFEQVSSSNFPNILALKALKIKQNSNSTIYQKALKYLDIGYQKLTAYEIKGGGFDWYGNAPAHEGLTAYGLVQFVEMKEVFEDVEDDMIQRTKDFLWSRRDGKGGFKQNVGKYGFRGNRTALFNAYITWALTLVQTEGLELELNAIQKEASKSKDLYRMSLAALALSNVGDSTQVEKMTKQIAKKITAMGVVNAKSESSLTYSKGISLHIETLSFSALALMRSKLDYSVLLSKILQEIESKRNFGTYGSSQSTVMALKAFLGYMQIKPLGQTNNNIRVVINGKEVVNQKISSATVQKISFDKLEKHLKKGKNKLEIHFEKNPNFSVNWDTKWYSKNFENSDTTALKLTCNWNKNKVKIGKTVRLNIQLTNQKTEGLASPMAIIGIPSGLSLQAWQLRKLQEQKAFDYYEIINNYLVLYYSELAPKASKKIALDLKTEFKGSFEAPTSSAFLYYMPENIYRIKSETIRID